METISPSSVGALVIDASVAVAIAAREANREVAALTVIRTFASNGYVFYAPGAIVTEVLYALCQQHQRNMLTSQEYDQAVIDFDAFMTKISGPPNGDASLIARIHALGKGYGCSRSADGAYIALAEELTFTVPTVLITFDQGLPNQAARNAPSVTVQVL